jgi:hypothetical protein
MRFLSLVAPTLEAMLDESDGTAAGLVKAFTAFARLPVAPSARLYIDNDMCLLECGRAAASVALHLTRQFSLNDLDGNYEHMEQLTLSLVFDTPAGDLAGGGAAEIWSGDDLNRWAEALRTHPVLLAIAGRSPASQRVEHSEV